MSIYRHATRTPRFFPSLRVATVGRKPDGTIIAEHNPQAEQVTLAGRLVRGVVWVLRHPTSLTPAAPALVFLAVAVVVGLRAALWLTLGLLLVLAGGWIAALYRGQSRVFGRRLGLPLVWWYRRWVTYGHRWLRVANRCRLTTTDHLGGQLAPRIRRVWLTSSGERLDIVLPVGMNPDELTRKAGILAHALGTTRPLRVEVTGPRSVRVQVQRRNPLAATIQPTPVAETLDVEVLRRVPVGLTETGQPWQLPMWGSHIFCGGLTGSGKGSILWSLLHGLAPFIRDGIVQIWAVDPKGGMELEQGAGLFARFERDDPEGMAQLLEDAAAAMDYRCRTVRGHHRLVTPTREMPLVVVIVDELASLTSLCGDRKISTRVERALGLLTTKGRAPGFTVVAFTQEVSKETARWRDLFPTKIALRLAKAVEVDMVLGDGSYDAGAHADEIPRHLPGSGYVLDETTAHPVAVRAAWHDDEAIADLVRAYGPTQLPLPLPDLPEPDAPAEVIDLSPAPTRKPRTPRKPVGVPADLPLTG